MQLSKLALTFIATILLAAPTYAQLGSPGLGGPSAGNPGMMPDASNAIQPTARLNILPNPTNGECLVGTGTDWATASCGSGTGMTTNAVNAVLPDARTNLGLGSSATHALTDFLQPSNNLSDVATAATARGNLGIESKAKCDNSTDDTAVISAELTAAYLSGRFVQLPGGICLITGLTVAQTVRLSGQGPGTDLRLKPGSTVPAITVTVSAGFAISTVQIDNMQISAPSNADIPGQGVAHGIRVKQAGSPIKTRVLLNNLRIHNMPGDCIHSSAGEFTSSGGWVEGVNIECTASGGNGLAANTSADWEFIGGQFHDNTLDNILCSSCGHFVFVGINSWDAGQRDYDLFNSDDIHLIGCETGAAQKDGVYVDNRTGGSLFITNCPNIGPNSLSSDQTYSDITLTAANTGNVYISGSYFYAPAMFTPGSHYNIESKGGNTGLVFSKNIKWGAGNWLASRVVNDKTKYAGDEPPVAWPTAVTVIGSTGGTATMTVQNASVSINHGVAHINLYAQTSSLAGLTGTLRVNNLPIAPITTTKEHFTCPLNVTGWTAPANYNWLAGAIEGEFSTSAIFLQRNAVNGGALAEPAVSEFASATALKIACDYKYIDNQ